MDEQKTLNLADPQVMKENLQYIRRAVVYDFVSDAFDVARGLPKLLTTFPDISRHPTELSQGYDRILALAQAVALPMLSEEEIEGFFRKGIVTAIREDDINLVDKVSTKLSQISWVEDRDELKKKLRFQLRQNFERLTVQSIKTSLGVTAPTTKQWIELAEKQQVESAEPLAVTIQSEPQFNALNPQEKKVLLRLLALDDTLSLSSGTPEGFENTVSVVDENGKRVTLQGGEIVPAFTVTEEELLKPFFSSETGAPPKGQSLPQPPPSTPSQKPTRTAKDYFNLIRDLNAKHATDDEYRYDQQEALLQKVGMDVKAVVKALHDALLVSDGQTALAALSVLARSGAIAAALEDDSIREAFELEFLAPLAKDNNINLDLAKGYLKAHSTDTKSIEAFLAWALTRSLNGDRVESARVGNQLENTLAALGSPDFIGMTYFDVTAGHFKWTLFTMQPDGRITW